MPLAVLSMHKLLVLCSYVLLAALGASCQRHYTITGFADASSIEGRKVSLSCLCGQRWTHLDSCAVTHGNFRMRGVADTVVMATLSVDDMPLMPLVLEPGKISVTIDNLRLKAVGTRHNDRLYDFLSQKNDLDALADDINRKELRMIMDGCHPDRVSAYRDSAYAALSGDMEALVLDFMQDNYDNVLGLCGFNMLTNGLPRPAMTPLIRKVLDASPESFRHQPAVQAFLAAAEGE